MNINRGTFITLALLRLVPDAKFANRGDDLDLVEWLDERPMPSAEMIDKEIDKIILDLPMNSLKTIRNRLLSESDWLAVQDRAMTDEEKAYRQALRDLPKNNPNVSFDSNETLTNVNWPKAPAILGKVSYTLQ